MSPAEQSDPPGGRACGFDPALVSPDAARILARVAPTQAPLLLLDSFGAAFARLAAEIHRRSARSRFTLLDLRRGHAAALDVALTSAAASSPGTLALDGIELLGGDAIELLCEALERVPLRLLSATRSDLATLAATWRADHFATISTVALRVPALARRAAEMPRLAAERTRALAEVLRRPAPALSIDALEALAAHDWPGDLPELDALLTRTLLAHEGESIAAADLLWRPEVGRPCQVPEPAERSSQARAHVERLEPLEPVAAEPAGGGTESTSGSAELDGLALSGGIAIEALAVELAHQLKNPMVTVKTFAQNGALLAADGAAYDRFRGLADEAIARMDTILDELLEFARLGPAHLKPVEVVGLLREALRAAWSTLAGKQVSLAGPNGVTLSVWSDPTHVAFALRALARHVVETVEARSPLGVDVDPGGSLQLHYRESGVATHLRGVTDASPTSLPLALLLVRGALAPAGGRLEIASAAGDVTIALKFAKTSPATEWSDQLRE